MRLLAYGDCAVLAELADTEDAVALAGALAALLEADPEAAALVEQIVPAARTVLVVGTDRPERLRNLLGRAAARSSETGPSVGDDTDPEVIEVPVVYDGEDLDEVAALTGLSVQEVIAAHTGQSWRVAFGGFAPGFGYLLGEDDRLHFPRREESRTVVPEGSVGLAGEYSGVYPTSSPGGWQLIGRTDLDLWDVDRDPPALLRPGVRVRFVGVGPTGARVAS